MAPDIEHPVVQEVRREMERDGYRRTSLGVDGPDSST